MANPVISNGIECSIEVTSTSVEVAQTQSLSVDINSSSATIEVSLTGVGVKGDQGVQGIPGPNTVGGFPFVIDAPQDSDLLQLKNSAWRNVRQTKITDGGNF